MSADQFAILVKPVADTHVNDQIVLALSDQPQIKLDDKTPVEQFA